MECLICHSFIQYSYLQSFKNFYLQCFNTLFAEFQNSWSNIAAFKTDDENILFHVT